MPSFLLVSLYEFQQFLQIVLWIAVPATILAIGLTIFLHYRRKRRPHGLEIAFQEDTASGEKALKHTNSDTLLQIQETARPEATQPEALPDWLASANPDNTSLLKKYEQEVRRYRENYAILEQDFRELEGKYTDLRNKAYHPDKETDTTLVAQLQQDIKGYKEKIGQLQQQQAEQKCLPDMLEEKKSQIEYLQHQLELRIKNYHLPEQQTGESALQLQQLHITVKESDEQVKKLTRELQEQRQQNAGLQTALAAQEDALRTLRENLQIERQKATALESNLENKSQLLTKIYGELALSLEHRAQEEPVQAALG